MTKPRAASSDGELISAVLAGETRAFDDLIERHFGLVHAIAFARLGNRETVEDLAQEVFLRAYLHLERLGPQGNFTGWISRITRNLAIDWLRRGQRASRLLPMVPLDERVLDVPGPEREGVRENMIQSERERALEEAIRGLPPEQREIVLLHFTEGLTQAEIAGRLDVHQTTVGRHLRAALRALRGALEPALRETATAWRPSKSSIARTSFVIASVAALSESAKAALVAAVPAGEVASATTAAKAGAAGAIGVIGFFQSLPAIIMGGAKAMGTGKGIAAAAVAVAAIGGSAFVALHEESPERSAVPADIQSAYPYTCTMTAMQDQTLSDSVEIEVLAPGRWREIRANDIFVWDTVGRPGRMLNLDPQRRIAIEQTLDDRAGNVITDPLSNFSQNPSSAQENLGRQQIDGRPADVRRERTSATIDGVDWTWVTTISVDPGTHLPIRIEQVQTGRGIERRHSWNDFAYHASLDESLFNMTPPEGYEVALSESAPSPAPIPPTEGIYAMGSDGQLIALAEFPFEELQRWESRIEAGEDAAAVIRELRIPSIPRDTRLIVNCPGADPRTHDLDQIVLETDNSPSLGAEWRELPGAPDAWEVVFHSPVVGDILSVTCVPQDPSETGAWLARFSGPTPVNQRPILPPVIRRSELPIAEIVQAEHGVSQPIPVGNRRRVRVICPPGFGGLEEFFVSIQLNFVYFDLHSQSNAQDPIQGSVAGSLQFTLLEQRPLLCLARGTYTDDGLVFRFLFDESPAFFEDVDSLSAQRDRGELNQGQWEYQRDLLIQSLWPELGWRESALAWYLHPQPTPELACRALYSLAISDSSGLPWSLFFTPEELEDLAQTEPLFRNLPPPEDLWGERREAVIRLSHDLDWTAGGEYGGISQSTPGPEGAVESLLDVHVDVWVHGQPRTIFIPRMLRANDRWGFVEGPTIRDQFSGTR